MTFWAKILPNDRWKILDLRNCLVCLIFCFILKKLSRNSISGLILLMLSEIISIVALHLTFIVHTDLYGPFENGGKGLRLIVHNQSSMPFPEVEGSYIPCGFLKDVAARRVSKLWQWNQHKCSSTIFYVQFTRPLTCTGEFISGDLWSYYISFIKGTTTIDVYWVYSIYSIYFPSKHAKSDALPNKTKKDRLHEKLGHVNYNYTKLCLITWYLNGELNLWIKKEAFQLPQVTKFEQVQGLEPRGTGWGPRKEVSTGPQSKHGDLLLWTDRQSDG